MTTPELSILVPVYNEARTLRPVMQAIRERCPGAEIIFIDDGSIDDSLAILRTEAKEGETVLTKKNGGKGSAIRMGLDHARGTWTAIQDADLEYDPAEILPMLEEAKKHPGSVVMGSRFLQDNPNLYRRFLIGNKVMTGWLNLLFWSRLTDSYTCFKLLPTDLFRSLHLQSRGFELEAEICAKCLRKGVPIREIPITYHPRTIEEGKKINGKDAVKGMWTILRLRLHEKRRNTNYPSL